jgi:hypothetical protein
MSRYVVKLIYLKKIKTSYSLEWREYIAVIIFVYFTMKEDNICSVQFNKSSEQVSSVSIGRSTTSIMYYDTVL